MLPLTLHELPFDMVPSEARTLLSLRSWSVDG